MYLHATPQHENSKVSNTNVKRGWNVQYLSLRVHLYQYTTCFPLSTCNQGCREVVCNLRARIWFWTPLPTQKPPKEFHGASVTPSCGGGQGGVQTADLPLQAKAVARNEEKLGRSQGGRQKGVVPPGTQQGQCCLLPEHVWAVHFVKLASCPELLAPGGTLGTAAPGAEALGRTWRSCHRVLGIVRRNFLVSDTMACDERWRLVLPMS